MPEKSHNENEASYYSAYNDSRSGTNRQIHKVTKIPVHNQPPQKMRLYTQVPTKNPAM